MEPVGLAVGVLGAAGLFNSCLDAIERFDSWRNFTDEARTLGTHLEAEKIRLKSWGRQVGFNNGAVSPDHHEALDDPQIVSTIRVHLSIIENLCTSASSTHLPEVGKIAGHARQLPLLGRVRTHASAPSESRRQKVKWALRDKAKCTAQVETLGLLIQDLYNLVPPDRAKGTQPVQRRAGNDAPGHVDDTFSSSDYWAAEFSRILVRIENDLEAETRREVHAWLLGHHSPNDLYDDALQRRLDSTCDWILTRPSFLEWVSPDFPPALAKVLWINGPAGFGKTILSARVVEHLRSKFNLPPAHFFFSSGFESLRDPFVAIRSWLTQILSHPAAFELMREERETQPSLVATRADIMRVFRKIVHAIPGLTFVLDGLDECTVMEDGWNDGCAGSVAGFLEAVQQAIANTNTRLMIVSRDEPEIRQCIVSNTSAATYEHKISIEDVQSDIEKYSRNVVDKRLPNKDETIKDDICRKLARRCSGQFLWVKMQEPSLRSGKNKKQLEAAIDRSPTGLEYIYERNWQRILVLPNEERARALSVLRWAAFAVRPLTVFEVTEALLINDNCDDLPANEMPDSIDQDYVDSEILGLCGSLVEVRNIASESSIGSRTVHLTHFSVKQFLIRRISTENSATAGGRLRISYEATQNNILAELCLRYVNFKSVWQTPSEENNRDIRSSFLGYAASSWNQHVLASKINDPKITRLINELFNSDKQNWHSWREWFELNDWGSKGETASEHVPASPLYYASRLNLTETVRFLVSERRCGIDDKTSSGMTPLTANCKNGVVEITKILLDGGAEITVRDNDGRTPLYLASSYGHIDVLRLLVDKGADIAVATMYGGTPLHAASQNGHTAVVRLLAEKGADIMATGNSGWTSLHLASCYGHIDVVWLLIDKGADSVAATQRRWTPLHLASQNGYIDVVRLLVDKGADIMATAAGGWTPLHVAAENGQVEVVKFLVDRGADDRAEDADGRTAFFLACARGQLEVIHQLPNRKITVTIKDRYGSTPIFAATRNGHDKVVAYLFTSEYPCIDFIDGLGRTLLYWAKRSGNAQVIEAVLQFAQRACIRVYDSDLTVEPSSIDIGETPRWCDVCTRFISDGRTFYTCTVCQGGDFDLCGECFEIGAQCRNGSHQLTLRETWS